MKRIRIVAFAVMFALSLVATQRDMKARGGGDDYCDYGDCGMLGLQCDFDCYWPWQQYQDYDASYCYASYDAYDNPWNCYHCECYIVN